VRGASIEPDELQHLHAAYLVATGQRPFVDFFEHHTPLFYFLGGALIDPVTADFQTLMHFRWLAFVCHLLVIAAGTALATGAGVEAGTAALVLLLSEIFSFAWGTTVLLDAYAAPLVLLSALVLARRPASLVAHLAAGLLLGAAIGFTQKAAFVVVAPVLLVALRVLGRERGSVARAAGELGALGLGLALVAVPIAWRLGPAGAKALWQDVVVLNATWKARRWPLGEGFIMASDGAPLWLLAGAGVLGAMYRVGSDRAPLRPAVLVTTAYLACFLGAVLFLPVVWYEYFVEVGPFAAVVAAFAATDLGRAAGLLDGDPLCLPTRRGTVGAGAGGLAAAVGLSIVMRLENGHYCPTIAPARLALAAAAGVACAIAARRAMRRGAGRPAALALLLLVCTFPLVNQLEWLRRTGLATQRTGLEFVLAHTGPEDLVFDGYSGLGVFRRHAYRYWFLHDEMLLMLSPAQRGADIVQALENPRVKVAIRDGFTSLLEPEVNRYLDANFRRGWSIVWMRRDGPRAPDASRASDPRRG
jgi:hypothetical protein